MLSHYLPMPDDSALHPDFVIDAVNNKTSLNFGAQSPTHYPFDIYEAYRMRITSLMNGALFALHYSSNLSTTEDARKREAIKQLYADKMKALDTFKARTQRQPVVFEAELYKLYAEELPKISGLTPKKLLIAETFYTWQELKRPERTTTYQRDLGAAGQLRIEQIVSSGNTPLTQRQKKEILRIRGDKKPKWFKQLDTWAQNSLLAIIPDKLSGDWSQYEKCRPASLRRIPGEANATDYQLIITHLSEKGEVPLVHSHACAQAAPTSYNMASDKNRQNSANESLNQLLLPRVGPAKEAFKKAWGITDDTLMPCQVPVLLGGLVTSSVQGGFISKFIDSTNASGSQNNTKLAMEKDKALEAYLNEHPDGRLRFFNLNVPLNAYLSIQVKPDDAFIAFSKKTHNKLKALVDLQKALSVVTAPVLAERERNLALLESTIEQIEALNGPTQHLRGRNRNFYLATLYDLATRLMGGLSTGNCKSSKDRKGCEIILAHSILINAAEQMVLNQKLQIPPFKAKAAERKHLVGIVGEVYTSGHHLLVAHDSSTGAPGIKDASILDNDIVAQLSSLRQGNQSSVYALSKEVAHFNTPGSFWKRFSPRIRFYAMITAAIIATLTTIILLASGIFSPLAIIGAGAAIKLGAAAVFVGGLTNIAVTSCGAALLTAGLCKLRDGIETYRYYKGSFATQMAKFPAPQPTNSGSGGSTQKMGQAGIMPSPPYIQPEPQPVIISRPTINIPEPEPLPQSQPKLSATR